MDPASRAFTWPTGRQLTRDGVAAVVVGLAALSAYVSSASLLFQGPLAVHLPAAIGAALLGGALLALLAAWRGTLPLASAGAVPSMVAVLSAIMAGVAASARPAAVLPTAVAALAIAALAVGLTWWLMGRRGWGGLTRYIPYPVIGGFMGATGWLMAVGGLGVATGRSFSAATLQAWLGGAADARLPVGLAAGVLLWAAGRRFRHPWALPGLLLAGALAIHAGLYGFGLDIAAARAQGWLQPAFTQALPLVPWQPELWAQVQGEVLLQQAGLIVSCVIVATLSLLLTLSSLEVAWETDCDINRDLRALGQGNLLAGLTGGLSGGPSLSRSVLNRSAGAQTRASGVLLALLCAAAIGWGGPVIALIPLPLLGGLLTAQGLEMLKTWLVDSRAKLGRRDYLTVLAMVAVTAVFGFLPAVCLGVLACCVDFAVSQAQFSPVRRLLTRAAWLSTVERAPDQAEWLMRHGAGLQIVELQGVLFFGSVTRLSRQVEALLQQPTPPQQLLFDFSRVRSADSSAAQALARLFKRAGQRGVAVQLCGLGDTQARTLAAAGALVLALPQRPADADAAVAAWDDALLAAPSPEAVPVAADLAARVARQLGAARAARVLALFEPRDLAAGEALFEQGAAADALYLLASGRLAVVVPAAGGAGEVTVRTVLPGSAVGEMGLLRQQARSATVRALVPAQLLRLGADRLAALEAEDPAAAAALFRLLLLQMASRLDQLTTQAHALAR